MKNIKRLEEITSFITDGKHGDCENEADSGYYFVSAKDIRNSEILYDYARQITKKDFLETHRRTNLEANDIVIVSTGATIGRMGLAKDRPETQRTTFQKSVAIVKPDKAKINPTWLYYYLQFDMNRIITVAGGAAQSNLLLRDLRAVKVKISSLNIQKKIAMILAAYDDLIENNLKRIKLLEEMAQITYEEWFVRLRFPGHESTPINPETSLPDGWRMGTMQDLFDFKNGYAFKSGTYIQDGQHKIVTIKNVQDGSFIPATTDTIAELPSNIKPHHHLSTGDIIMSLTGNVGRVCLVYGENYLLNQRVAKVVPNNPADRLYVYALLRSRGTLTQLENISNGAAQQNLSPVNASKMPTLVPARNVVDDFNKNIGSIIDLICLKNIENNRLREARDILLPRLMTGVIDVESYDPSQLLKEAA